MTDSKDELMENTSLQENTENAFMQAESLDMAAPIPPEQPVAEPLPPIMPDTTVPNPSEQPVPEHMPPVMPDIPPYMPPVVPPELPKKKSKKKLWIILSIVGALLIGAALSWFLYFDDFMAYNAAQDLLDAKKYDQAITAFAELGDFKDSKEKITECKYQKANYLLGQGEFEQAMELFEDLGNYKKSKSQILECRYGIALQLIENNEYEQAYALLKELDGYKSSASMSEKFVWKLAEEHAPGGTCHYSYDVKGNIVTKTYVDTIISYTYNKDGLLEKEEYTGNNTQTVEYTYDADKNKRTEKIISEDGETFVLTTYTYKNGELESAVQTNQDDEILSTTEYVYNSKNLLARQIYTNKEEEKTYTEYTYNGQKLMTEKKVIHPDDSEEITTYSYNADGLLIAEKFETEDVLETTEYTYDEHGNNTIILFTDTDGNELETENKYIFMMLQ